MALQFSDKIVILVGGGGVKTPIISVTVHNECKNLIEIYFFQSLRFPLNPEIDSYHNFRNVDMQEKVKNIIYYT